MKNIRLSHLREYVTNTNVNAYDAGMDWFLVQYASSQWSYALYGMHCIYFNGIYLIDSEFLHEYETEGETQ